MKFKNTTIFIFFRFFWITKQKSKIIIIGKKFIVTFDDLRGLFEFKSDRDKLRERHNKEFKFLFAPSKIRWKNKINGESFENLIYDLLERETNVLWVRKVAHTNESDGGRDLIVKWRINRNTAEELSEKSRPYIEKEVIVQCKAYNKGVGKSDVIDIRDTIEFNNYAGYFLAVSSYTKRSLTDHLDNMRIKGKYWIDWWTRQEIDERLKSNPDLISKYPEIFE